MDTKISTSVNAAGRRRTRRLGVDRRQKGLIGDERVKT